MKKRRMTGLGDRYPSLVTLVLLLLIGFFAQGQSVYRPSNSSFFTPSNKPYGVAQAVPIDGMSMKLDSVNGLFRPFNGTAEVLTYFPVTIPQYRAGNHIIIVDSGGTLLSNGSYINGVNTFYMWKDSLTNGGLVKLNWLGTSGCGGCLIATNNLSDLANAATARTNLGLGTMATQNIAAGGDLSGNWNNITVSKFNNQLPSYYLNYENLTNTPPLVSLTTIGTSGPATYNIGTGILNIPLYSSGGGGSCLNCNADTIGNIPLVFTTFCNNCVLTLDSITGIASWQPSAGGVASLPPNTGTGFRIYSPQIPAIKSLICNSGCTIDSTSNSGALTFNITSGGSGTVTAFSAGALNPIFTTSVATATTTPALTFVLSNANAYNILGNNTASPTTPVYFAPTSTILNTWFGGAGIQPVITFTTTGTGAPTFISNTLNIPTAVMTYSQLATTNTLNLNPGNTQTFLVATHALAGLMDSASKAVTDSLRLRTYTWPTYNLYAVNGIGPMGTHGDSLQRGGILGSFFQNDSDYYANNSWFIYNLNASFSTLVAGDSVMVHGSNGQVKFLPSSAIGGGDAITSPNSTLTVGGTSANTTLDLNLNTVNSWNANILFGANNTYTLGNGTNNLASVNTQQVLSNNNQLFGIPTGKTYSWNINNVTKAEILATGQQQWSGYTATSSFTLGSAVGMLVFDASGNIGTQAISGGGSVTINGTSGSMSGSTLTLAVSGTSTTATGLTIPASGTTATFTYPAAWDFGDKTRGANLNAFWGPLTGNTTLTGLNNTAFGSQAGGAITSGQYNTFAGSQSGYPNTTGSQNAFFGWVTGFANTTGSENTFIGAGAASSNITGSHNTYVGGVSGDLALNGNDNAYLGYQSGETESGAPEGNVFLGMNVRSITAATDSFSIAIGFKNGQSNLDSIKNSIDIGYNQQNNYNIYELNDINIGGSTSVGFNKGIIQNYTNIGHSVLAWQDSIANFGTRSQVITLGDSGVATHANLVTMPKYSGGIVMERDSLGTGSGYFVWVAADAAWEQIPTTWHSGGFASPMTTTGDLISLSGGVPVRIAAGTSGYALVSNGPGTLPTWQNLSSGSLTTVAYSTTGNANAGSISGATITLAGATSTTPGGINASGAQTLGITMTLNHDAVINGETVGRGASTGLQNTAIGNGAMSTASTYTGSTAVGFDALYNANSSGGNNTAVGAYSEINMTSGHDNTGVGYHTLYSNTTGSQNTAVGSFAGITNGPSYATSIGYAALQFSSGNYNTAIGNITLTGNTTGTNNLGLGAGALSGNTTGSYNIANGTNTGLTNVSGSYNLLLGSYVDVPTSTTSNYGSIGNVILMTGLPSPTSTTSTPVVGQVGIGIAPLSTATLTLAAGTTTQAAFNITAGSLLTTPVNGAIEATSTHVYYTAGGTRYQLDQQGGSLPLTTTGDMIYSSSGSTAARLPIGSTNQVLAVISGVPTWSSNYATLASPAFTGTPTAPTASGSTNTTQLATTAMVQAAILANSTAAANVTPTLTNTTNIASSSSTSAYYSSSMGNQPVIIEHYKVSGTLTPSVGSLVTVLTISVPFFFNNSIGDNVGQGVININGGTAFVTGIVTVASSSTLTFSFIPTAAVSSSFVFTADFN